MFSTINLFELVLDNEMKLVELKVNHQKTRDGWGSLVHEGDSRVDVFLFSYGDQYHISVIPVSGFCTYCEKENQKYGIQLAFVDGGWLPRYRCLCNMLDGKQRDFDTIRYVDIFEHQLVSVTPLRKLKLQQEGFKQPM